MDTEIIDEHEEELESMDESEDNDEPENIDEPKNIVESENTDDFETKVDTEHVEDNKDTVFNVDNVDDGDFKPSKAGDVAFPHENKFQHIRNKMVRNQKFQKFKKETAKAKKLEKKERKQSSAPKQVPHTLETLREKDETTVGDINAEDNEIVRADLDEDEFANYYQQTYEPKTLITFSDNPTTKTRIFGRELTRIIPNSNFLYRNRSGVKKMVRSAIANNYTDILIVNENRKEPNGLLVIHLPDGPTAHFKLSNVKITPELRKSHKAISEHRPEVVLNQFSTRLGMGVGRMLGALFHYSPEFVGRRVVTFHNQRDYIFFRHYKYTFNDDGTKSRFKELGPRFTLKLQSLQKGTFDSKFGEFEWIMEGRRRKVETSRRKFVL